MLLLVLALHTAASPNQPDAGFRLVREGADVADAPKARYRLSASNSQEGQRAIWTRCDVPAA